jgi:hypothetical protein
MGIMMKKQIRRRMIFGAGALFCALAANAFIARTKDVTAAVAPDAQTLQRIETVAKRGPFRPNWKWPVRSV